MLPDPSSFDFPFALKLARFNLGVSIKDLATKAGMSKNIIYRYENKNIKGFCKPSAKSFKKLKDALIFFKNKQPQETKVFKEQLDLIPEERLLKDATLDELLNTIKLKFENK